MPWTDSARKAANFLASIPSGQTTLMESDVQSLLLESGGILLARGSLYNIKVTNLGASVYKVTLVIP